MFLLPVLISSLTRRVTSADIGLLWHDGGVGGLHGNTSDCAVLCQGMLRNPAEEDIRASILRHADKEGDQFSTFTKAYAKTQPERIFAEEEKDEEGSDKEA